MSKQTSAYTYEHRGIRTRLTAVAEGVLRITRTRRDAFLDMESPAVVCRSTIPMEVTEAGETSLLTLGQLSAARQALLRIATRSAEWNYLFGAQMKRTAEYEKGILYLSVAANQSPDVEKYVNALKSIAFSALGILP